MAQSIDRQIELIRGEIWGLERPLRAAVVELFWPDQVMTNIHDMLEMFTQGQPQYKVLSDLYGMERLKFRVVYLESFKPNLDQDAREIFLNLINLLRISLLTMRINIDIRSSEEAPWKPYTCNVVNDQNIINLLS